MILFAIHCSICGLSLFLSMVAIKIDGHFASWAVSGISSVGLERALWEREAEGSSPLSPTELTPSVFGRIVQAPLRGTSPLSPTELTPSVFGRIVQAPLRGTSPLSPTEFREILPPQQKIVRIRKWQLYLFLWSFCIS